MSESKRIAKIVQIKRDVALEIDPFFKVDGVVQNLFEYDHEVAISLEMNELWGASLSRVDDETRLILYGRAGVRIKGRIDIIIGNVTYSMDARHYAKEHEKTIVPKGFGPKLKHGTIGTVKIHADLLSSRPEVSPNKV